MFKEVEVLLFAFFINKNDEGTGGDELRDIRAEAAKVKQLLLSSDYFIDRWNPTFNKPVVVTLFIMNDSGKSMIAAIPCLKT